MILLPKREGSIADAIVDEAYTVRNSWGHGKRRAFFVQSYVPFVVKDII
jgi:hypothetical protein